MKYAAFIYFTNHDIIEQVRPAHREYLAGLKEAGNVFAAGRFDDGSGALIVYEAETEDEARQLIENDPFNRSGVFARYDVKPWAMTTLIVRSE